MIAIVSFIRNAERSPILKIMVNKRISGDLAFLKRRKEVLER